MFMVTGFTVIIMVTLWFWSSSWSYGYSDIFMVMIVVMDTFIGMVKIKVMFMIPATILAMILDLTLH